MAKVRTRYPKVFVGHPFKKRFPVESFRKIFRDLPFKVIYGNTDIETKQLLKVLKGHINNVDYCIFDLTYWNPNVALELGMVEGLKNNPQKNYYIILDSKKSKEVPSDIKGIQRLEYTKLDFTPSGLGAQLLTLLRKEHYSKKLLQKFGSTFENHSKREKAFVASMKILGHFKDFNALSRENITPIFRGTHLHEKDRRKIFDAFMDLGMIQEKNDKFNIKLNKKIFS